MSTTTQKRGLYPLCAVSPTGEVYFTQVATDASVSGPGWTFAPIWVANMLKLAAATTEIDSVCARLPAVPEEC
jgi:hypothetical protein